jgi:hypothetical protein
VGLTYLRARWYAPGVGRFISKDLFPVMNRWLYADANPVNRVDPSGYFSNDAIARSLGVSSFDEVIQMFDKKSPRTSITEGRWGLLRLLQEAEDFNNLSYLWVQVFGLSHRIEAGMLWEAGCSSIMVRDMSLASWLRSLEQQHCQVRYQTDRGLTCGALHNPVQAYYLDGRPFRDDLHDLPDLAVYSVNFDIVVGTQLAYIVDRYGHAYISVVPPLPWPGLGGGASIGYSEGWVNRMPWQGGWSHGMSPIPTEEELANIISGWDLVVSANLLVMSFGGEVNVDHTIDDYWVGYAGFILGLHMGVGGELSYTTQPLPSGWSVNPEGWHWVDQLPSYGKDDILGQ